MEPDLLFDSQQLIKEAQSADDVVRRSAEAQLLELSDRDASLVFLSFMKVASDSQELLSSRQFALVSLRKLITMYWSPGFESYRSCSNLKEEAKETVRDYLLKLCVNDQELSKFQRLTFLINGLNYSQYSTMGSLISIHFQQCRY